MPERLLLAEPERRDAWDERLREKLPALADRLDYLDPDRDPDEMIGHVLATRRSGEEFVAAHPDVKGAVELDCQWVECMTSPFVDPILRAWPQAVFVNANEDVQAIVELVRERLGNT